jgi:TonB family protein
MKALSSAVSITLHVAVGAALLLGTTKTVRSDPARPREVRVVLPREVAVNRGDGMGGPSLPGPIDVAPPDFNSMSGLAPTPEGLMPKEGLSVFSPTGGSESSATTGWSGVPTEEHAEVLTGPLPVYPDLLRQAGVQGRVVLEAVVDTTGRVLAPSILVVSRTNPGFVAPARQALLATLFRPAMVGGKPVRMRVRIPYEFAIRNGIGRAR